MISQKYFQVHGKYFEQYQRTAMSNCQSQFLANLFIDHFEKQIKISSKYFPVGMAKKLLC